MMMIMIMMHGYNKEKYDVILRLDSLAEPVFDLGLVELLSLCNQIRETCVPCCVSEEKNNEYISVNIIQREKKSKNNTDIV